jgi:hypothetical protein
MGLGVGERAGGVWGWERGRVGDLVARARRGWVLVVGFFGRNPAADRDSERFFGDCELLPLHVSRMIVVHRVS